MRSRRIALSILIIIITLTVISIILITTSDEEKERDLVFHFDNPTFMECHPQFTAPAEMNRILRDRLDFYCPSVMQLAELYYSSGPEQALLALHEKLSSSTDEAELLEIAETLLFDGGGTPLMYRNPEIVFGLFKDRDDPTWSDEQRAAADYLVALAFARGDFRGSLLSKEEEEIVAAYNMVEEDDKEAEEICKRLSEKLEGIRKEGKDRLKGIWETYPNTRVAMLAGFDYLVEIAYQTEGATDLAFAEELLQVSLDNYPNSAFLTGAYIRVANAYRDLGDTSRALEYYTNALACPDYRAPSNDQMTHEHIEKLMKKLEK